MESKKTIEVHGTTYDARTGAVVSVATAPTVRKGGQNIDGFFRSRTVTTLKSEAPPVVDTHVDSDSHVPPTPSAPELKVERHKADRNINHTQHHVQQPAHARLIHITEHTSKPQTLSVFIDRTAANHIRHRATQHSTTLRRDAVPTPAPSTHNSLRPVGALQHTAPGVIEVKHIASNVDQVRMSRAQKTEKSPFISHHYAPSPKVVPVFAPVSIKPTPSPTPAPGSGGAPTAPPPQQTNKPIDIFEKALARADNFVDIHEHRKKYKKRARTHIASMTAGSLALIVIAAFIAYQNNPGLQFKVASVEAGVSASMPNLTATDFTYNGVRAGYGKLTVGLKSPNGNFQLTQANTNLSDAEMIQTINATNANGNPTYTTVDAGGVVVYRFSNTNATWVSGGEWYTINGDGALSNNQIKTLVQNT